MACTLLLLRWLCVHVLGLCKETYKPIYKHFHNGVWQRKSCKIATIRTSLTSLHTIVVLYALHSIDRHVHVSWSPSTCEQTRTHTNAMWNKKGKRIEPKGMCNSFFFRRFVRLTFSVYFYHFRLVYTFTAFAANFLCWGNRFKYKRNRQKVRQKYSDRKSEWLAKKERKKNW